MIRTYRRTLPHDRRNLLESYRYVHAARKVVGVGSVGTRTWILLSGGSGRLRSAVPPIQGGAAISARAVPRAEPILTARAARRRGAADDAGSADIVLGWERIVTIDGEKRDFYIRQLWDAKGSAEIELMDPAGLEAYGGSAAGRSPEHTRVRATGSRSPPTSAAAGRSTARWHRSPRLTPIRTSSTTASFRPQSYPGESLPRLESDHLHPLVTGPFLA